MLQITNPILKRLMLEQIVEQIDGGGLDDLLGHRVLHVLFGNLVRTEGPPAEAAVLRSVLGVAGAAGHGQAQGKC